MKLNANEKRQQAVFLWRTKDVTGVILCIVVRKITNFWVDIRVCGGSAGRS
ncbi:MAG: hypothetical protein JPMHGGIA_00678 [Saprospiraceae bacterium]|jgi:hypothetical protein|nr:hypothetical protein [Saprospiraceae bacterium]